MGRVMLGLGWDVRVSRNVASPFWNGSAMNIKRRHWSPAPNHPCSARSRAVGRGSYGVARRRAGGRASWRNESAGQRDPRVLSRNGTRLLSSAPCSPRRFRAPKARRYRRPGKGRAVVDSGANVTRHWVSTLWRRRPPTRSPPTSVGPAGRLHQPDTGCCGPLVECRGPSLSVAVSAWWW